MGAVVYSAQSREDIIDIWIQVSSYNANAADDCLDKIEARCSQLVDFPELGPKRIDIASNARALLVERWLIIYRTIEGGVFVIRIVDGARDLSKLTLPDD